MNTISQLLNNKSTSVEMAPNVPQELQEKYFLPPFLPPNVLKFYLTEQEDEEGAGGEEMGGEAGEGGGEAGILGLPGEGEPLSITDIGRMVELKKIYSRLMAISDFLKGKGDKRLLPIKKAVDDVIYLFEVIVNNFNQYKDNIDEIIVQYYKFIKEALKKIKTVFKRMKDEDEKQRKKRERLLRQYTQKELKARGGSL